MKSIVFSLLLYSCFTSIAWHECKADDVLEDILAEDEGMPDFENEPGASVPTDAVPAAPAPSTPMTPAAEPDATAAQETPLQGGDVLQLQEQAMPLIQNQKISAHFKKSDEEISNIITTVSAIRQLSQTLHEMMRALDEKLDRFFQQTAIDIGQLKKSITPSEQANKQT